jgi:hypothetical protein
MLAQKLERLVVVRSEEERSRAGNAAISYISDLYPTTRTIPLFPSFISPILLSMDDVDASSQPKSRSHTLTLSLYRRRF